MDIQLDLTNLNAITDGNEELNQKLIVAFLDELKAVRLFFEREEYKIIELFSARYHKLLPSLEMFGLQEYASALLLLKERIKETGWTDECAVLKDQCCHYLSAITDLANRYQEQRLF